ncbi:hypothetical protein TBLA_0C05060 [Henningerozyma blattae CBS 6284]|uniref:Uncharacterized protein n=1 Tax=Henningerozyma blattae (strain ATCC 34711 / CBS 6284 / DSM 70876 / NBRC 10599 / NRRL Y-10934 / UCD 77-7) TaxID=1071380 RepID=I2H1Q0_HENB6|nr:hypothetical protein TBLA_0C05060 [Tetrapisispora blattae CBS 6284]CCH60302.1 hypothetical protein TBLA_0C05060 [Tetrapisispora blattae CBS 6284]
MPNEIKGRKSFKGDRYQMIRIESGSNADTVKTSSSSMNGLKNSINIDDTTLEKIAQYRKLLKKTNPSSRNEVKNELDVIRLLQNSLLHQDHKRESHSEDISVPLIMKNTTNVSTEKKRRSSITEESILSGTTYYNQNTNSTTNTTSASKNRNRFSFVSSNDTEFDEFLFHEDITLNLQNNDENENDYIRKVDELEMELNDLKLQYCLLKDTIDNKDHIIKPQESQTVLLRQQPETYTSTGNNNNNNNNRFKMKRITKSELDTLDASSLSSIDT